MFIQSLRLHDFRSYHQVLLTPPAGVTVFVGENGAGKTNLLEAVHLCCLGRSHRTAFDREMIRAGQETAAVQVRVQRADGVDEVGVRLYSPLQKKRKLLYINGKTAARTGRADGACHVRDVLARGSGHRARRAPGTAAVCGYAAVPVRGGLLLRPANL